MTKKRLRLISILLHIISTIMLFIPGMVYIVETTSVGNSSLIVRTPNSFVMFCDYVVIRDCLVAFMIGLVLSILLLFINKNNIFVRLMKIISLLVTSWNLFVIVLFAFTVSETAHTIASAGFLSYIQIVVWLVILGLSFADLFMREKEPHTKEDKITVSSDNLETLEKYKTLLDNGTITQEEFDAKKKQLLEL